MLITTLNSGIGSRCQNHRTYHRSPYTNVKDMTKLWAVDQSCYTFILGIDIDSPTNCNWIDCVKAVPLMYKIPQPSIHGMVKSMIILWCQSGNNQATPFK
eukprot:TRINITY_DN9118_c0_g2_i1.p1 TRINITY_DN9118_c0_g2~~TRINITY_DN9118_c0_g2_i1.p1  ORF type:complete len:100 (-),score=2.82 TRINITY_DN9118_c0_g2_i1:435-734(-)